MQLTIKGQPQTFIPIKTFRNQWDLPDEFQVDYFEPKMWSGLGSMEGSGPALTAMRQSVLETISDEVTFDNLLNVVDLLTDNCRYQFEQANQQMGLRLHDVGFAMAGFEDVMRGVAYDLLRLKHIYHDDLAQIRQNFNFKLVYNNWLADSVRLSATINSYQNNNQLFEVCIVNHIYGRVGLEVRIANEVYYVTDKTLACPGENYMEELCQAIAQTMGDRLC